MSDGGGIGTKVIVGVTVGIAGVVAAYFLVPSGRCVPGEQKECNGGKVRYCRADGTYGECMAPGAIGPEPGPPTKTTAVQPQPQPHGKPVRPPPCSADTWVLVLSATGDAGRHDMTQIRLPIMTRETSYRYQVFKQDGDRYTLTTGPYCVDEAKKVQNALNAWLEKKWAGGVHTTLRSLPPSGTLVP